jgi:hypothetical protein
MKRLFTYCTAAILGLAMACSNPKQTTTYKELVQLDEVVTHGLNLLKKQEQRFAAEHKMMTDSIFLLKDKNKKILQKSVDEGHAALMARHGQLVRKHEAMLAETKQLEAKVEEKAVTVEQMNTQVKALRKRYLDAQNEYTQVMTQKADKFNKFLEEYEKYRLAAKATQKKAAQAK